MKPLYTLIKQCSNNIEALNYNIASLSKDKAEDRRLKGSTQMRIPKSTSAKQMELEDKLKLIKQRALSEILTATIEVSSEEREILYGEKDKIVTDMKANSREAI